MNSASTTRTIKFISKAGTYTALIMSPSGDLYQEYEGSMTNPTAIRPDFAQLKPILYFVCTSSRVAEGIATPDSIEFMFGNTKITFSGDTSTGVFAGMFKKVAPSGDNPYYGLQILQNIASAAGFASATIKMIAHISYGTQSDSIQADYTIPVSQATGDGYRVTIAAGDNNNFVIREKGGQCILKAMTFQAGVLLSGNLTYQWYKLGTSDWQALTNKTAQTLTVAEADINTYGEYMVRVYLNGSEIGRDIQGVMDASDPYDIDPHPSPEDEAIYEDVNGNGSVTYTPVVVKRGTNVKALSTLFTFMAKDGAGVILNPNPGAAAASFTVTRDMCVQSGGDVAVVITSVD